jgi:hypothetical protein
MSRLTEAQIADLKDRVDLADLAQGLGARLRQSAGRWVGSCPICGGGRLATRFEIKASGWVCAVCEDGGDAISLVRKATGCDFGSAIERLGGPRVLTPEEERKLAGDRANKEKREKAQAESYRRSEIAACRRIWEMGRAPTADRLGRYHAGRGLLLPSTALIRELDNAAYFHGEEVDERGRRQPRVLYRGPAQVAAQIDNDGEFVGVHITYLLADWSAKVELSDPETGELLPSKKMRGSKKGAHIVLRTPASAEIERARREGQPVRLFMGEGIETVGQVGTSLKHARRLMPADMFWASGDLGNLGGAHLGTVAHPTLKTPKGRPQRIPGPEPDVDAAAILIPAEVTHLCLLGDGDSEPFLTSTTMERARRRYARPGLTIGIAMAAAGEDFNSMRVTG